MKDNRDTTEYFKEWQNMKLSETSRARIHEELMEYADFHAVNESVSLATDGRSIEQAPHRGALSVFKFSFMPYLVLIAIVIGGGTSYAAAGALPGDVLYPIKTEVNESVKSAFTFGAEAEVALQAELVAERLREAEELEAEGRLTSAAATTIATNLRRHTAAAEAALQASEESDTRTFGAIITANLERFNQLVINDASLAIDLSMIGRTGADGSFTTSLATQEIAVSELQAMTTARLNSLTNVVTTKQAELSAEAYAEFKTKLDTASELSADVDVATEADARAAFNTIAELLGDVEAKLSTLGTVKIDENSGAIVDIDFSRVPALRIEDEMRGDVTITATSDDSESVDSEDETADPLLEADTSIDINSSGPGGINIEGSGAVRSGLSL